MLIDRVVLINYRLLSVLIKMASTNPTMSFLIDTTYDSS